MKQLLLGFIFTLMHFTSTAQLTKNWSVGGSGNIGQFKKGDIYLKPSFLLGNIFAASKIDRETTFGLNIGGGIFISKNVSVGLEILSNTRSRKFRNISQLQPNGIFYYDRGTKTDLKSSYGSTLNIVKNVKGDLYLDLGFFFHILKGKSIEKGSIVDQNNISVGIDYEKTKKILYQNSIGLNTSMIYLFNDFVGIHCGILQLNIETVKFDGSHANIVLPSYIGILLKF